ncbi:hypothetical protein [Pedobacter aquatilis]|uniref:hypothetical protein n=1 Tax=Pedobacter aquatilis TaxID=351343 RepID=UPI00292F4F9E|nr:hypothetical protein [Pedobacter aquatilis]
MIPAHEIEKLKEMILIRAGLTAIDDRACGEISILIFKHNGNYISKVTLLRLYGLMAEGESTLSPVVATMLWDFAHGKRY